MNIDFEKLILLLCILWGLKKFANWMQREKPAFGFSSRVPASKTFRFKFSQINKPLFWLALFFFSLPFCNPSLKEATPFAGTPIPREGIAIYLLIDESGSMQEKLRFGNGEELTKSDWVKKLASDLIKKEKNDLIGLIGFARSAHISCPLTLDRAELLERLSHMSVVQSDEEEGTAIGYAIYKTVNLIVSTKHFAERARQKREPAYSIENQVIIILTDGLQSPNPLDKNNPFRFMRPEEAADFAAQNGIRVYYVGVDPALLNAEFSYEAQKMREAVMATKGDFFISTTTAPLEKIYEEIDVLQKSKLPQEIRKTSEHLYSLAPFCITIGLLLLFASILIECVFARTAP